MDVFYLNPVLTVITSQSQHLNHMALATTLNGLVRQIRKFSNPDNVDNESIYTRFSFDGELCHTAVL
jgi:hypothetical protein